MAEGLPKEIVLVAGERVALKPTNLPPGDPIGVDFDMYYKPDGLQPSDTTLLKATFQELFGGTALPVFDSTLQKDLDQRTSQAFLPPCDPSQKALVLQSLEYRMTKLRQEMGAKGIVSARDIATKLEKERSIGPIDAKDTAGLRDMFRHYQTLKSLIDNYNTKQQCVSMSDKAFGDLQFDLTDDRAKELLRQFIFFTLQAHHPLQDYKKTNPTAPQFIKRLEVNPLGEPTFKSFLTTYQGNKLPIPESIARVLESVEAKSGVLDGQLKERLAQAIQSEKDKIVKLLLTVFPSEHRFWTTVGKEKDLYKMVDTVLEYMNVADGDAQRLTKEVQSLQDKLRRCEANSALLTQNYSRIEAQVKDLQTRLAADGTKDDTIRELRLTLERAQSDYAARLEENAREMEEYGRRIAANEQAIARITNENIALRGRIAELEPQLAALRDIEGRKDAEIRQLVQQHATSLAEEQARTATERGAKEDALQQRTAALADLEAARVELRGQQETLRAQGERINTLTADLASITKQKSDCDTLTADLRAKLAAANSELETLRAEVLRFTQQIAAKDEEIRSILTAAGEKEEEDEERIRELTEEIARLKAQLADVTARANACEEARAALEAKATEPENRAAALAAQAKELETQLAAANAEQQRLREDNERLTTELRNKNAALKQTGDERDEAKAQALAAAGRVTEADATIGILEGQIGALEGDIRTKSEELAAAEAKRREEAAAHESTIGELTTEYKGLLDAKTRELGEETRRADQTKEELVAERGKVEKSEDAYQRLQAAIEALLTGPESAVQEAIAAASDAGEQTKGSLQTIYRKLQELEGFAADKTPMSHAEESVQKKLSQCYNVFLLTYLWQTNFPAGDAQTEAFLAKVNGIFSGRPTVTGVYKTSPTGTILEYLNLVIKLLSVYDGEPDKSVELSEKEKNYFNLILAVLPKLRDGKPLVDEARDYFTSHQPKAPLQDANLLFEGGAVRQDPYGQLNFPLLYYCFLVVMRDYLNTITGSLGRCPLPKILQGPQRRGSTSSI